MTTILATFVDALPNGRRLRIPFTVKVLVLYVVVALFFVPRFLGLLNVTSILFSVAVLLPATLGMQLLLVLGRFDLSLGAIASFVGMIVGLMTVHNHSLLLSILVGLAAGSLAGCFIGILVAKFALDPLIVTLAALGIIRSLSLVVYDGRIIAGLPDSLGWLAEARLGSVPVLIVGTVVVAAIVATASRHLILFRRFYAAGNNAEAASHAGIDVPGLLILGYTLAGLGAALTGLIQTSRTLSSSPLLFDALPIEAIAACIIGGSSLSGGRGGIIGASIGLVVVAATNNLVIMLGISVYWQSLAVGMLLLLAVMGDPVTDALRNRFTNFKWRKPRK
jgi:ribose transport system permease protein